MTMHVIGAGVGRTGTYSLKLALNFEVKQGWEPLCVFLGIPVPDEDFPRTNDRGEFWDRVQGKI